MNIKLNMNINIIRKYYFTKRNNNSKKLGVKARCLQQ